MTPGPQATPAAKPSVSWNMVANIGGQAWVTLLMVAFVPVFIRHLGMESYGLIGLFMTLQVVMTIFDAGMSPTLNREMARFTSGAIGPEDARDLLRSVETLAIGLAVVLSLLAAAFAGPASVSWLNIATLDPATVRTALVLMGMVLSVRFIEAIYRGAILGLQLQVWFNSANALLNTIRHGGAALVVAFVAPDIIAFFAWYLLTSVVIALVFRWRLNRALQGGARPGRFSVEALKPIYRFALGMLGINLLTILLTQVDKLLLARLLPLAEFGTYMLAFSAASVLGVMAAAITQAFLPVMVEHISRGDAPGLARNHHLASQLVGAMVIPAGLTLILWPEDVLMLWSGDPALAAQAARLLSLLAAGMLLNAMMMQPYFAMVAHGWTRLAMLSNLVAVLVLLPAILLAVPRAGSEAAALIWMGLNAGYILIQIPLMHRRILPGEMGAWYLRDLALPLAAATGAGLLLAELRPMLDIPRPLLLLSLGTSWAVMLVALSAVSGQIRARYGPKRSGRMPT